MKVVNCHSIITFNFLSIYCQKILKSLAIISLFICTNIFANSASDNQLLEIAENPNTTVTQIKKLLKAGADIKDKDKGGSTALMAASANNENPAIITTLLRAGAIMSSELKQKILAKMLKGKNLYSLSKKEKQDYEYIKSLPTSN